MVFECYLKKKKISNFFMPLMFNHKENNFVVVSFYHS